MQAHYRSVLDLSEDALNASEKGYNKLMNAFKLLDNIKPSKKAFVPLKDKINMKTLKYKMRLIKMNRKIQKILN